MQTQKLNLKNLKIVKQTENYFAALCPYHDETIPSLMVHRTGNRAGDWKCWGCGAYGVLTNSEMQKLGCNKTQIVKRKSPDEWERLQEFYAPNPIGNLARMSIIERFAKLWAVSNQTIIDAGAGTKFDYHFREHLSFPMRSAIGQIVGIQRRFVDGTKRNITGSNLGLFYIYPVKPSKILCITEGLTDTLTLSNWGYWATGIASATTNPKIVVDFLKIHLTNDIKNVILIADSDKAGINLMYNIQTMIRKEINLVINKATSLVVPPSPIKDLRNWVKAGLTKNDFEKLIKI